MKIAFILYQAGVITGKSNGIRSQAITWKKCLESKSIEVVLINAWDNYDWGEFDAIHFFGYDLNLLNFVRSIYKYNRNLFISPIIDSTKSYYSYRIASLNGIEKLRLLSINYVLKKSISYFKGVLVRTNHEKGYIINSFKTPAEKVKLVELSYSLPVPEKIDTIIAQKKDFCLHISSLYQDRKNVQQLIESAKKYDFELKLAGNVGNKEQHNLIKSWIGEAKNIELLGYVSYENLIQLYVEAKVFALPSTCEGVGIVALDAALYGDNIVMTNIKGPKEYYPNCSNISFCDPHNIDSIGKSILDQLSIASSRELYDYISVKYAKDILTQKLIEVYSA